MPGRPSSKYRSQPQLFCIRCNDYVIGRENCNICGEKPHRFPSKLECRRYCELHIMEACREISDLELQPRFPIIVNNIKVGEYRSDFRYKEKDGTVIVEEAKGFRTPVYKLKKKIIEAQYGIKIKET